MSLQAIMEAAAFALGHGAKPIFLFLLLWGVVQSSPIGTPPSHGRCRVMLWAAGLFTLVGVLKPGAGLLVHFSDGNYIIEEFQSSVWLACSIGLCLLAMRLLQRMSASGVVMIGIDSLLIAVHLGSWVIRSR